MRLRKFRRELRDVCECAVGVGANVQLLELDIAEFSSIKPPKQYLEVDVFGGRYSPTK